MRRKFSLLVALVVVLSMMFSASMAMAATVTGTSTATITIPTSVAIAGLGPIAFALTFAGAPALGSGSGADPFTVEANVTSTIAAAITTSPATLLTPYLAASVAPGVGGIGSTPITLTVAAAAVPLSVPKGAYVEQATVTVTYTP